jgi:hypothetical protein
VQCHNGNIAGREEAEQAIDKILRGTDTKAPAVDKFRVTNGFDLEESRVWVAYWTQSEGYAATIRKLDLCKLWNDLGEKKSEVGFWLERFTAPIERSVEGLFAGKC